MTFKGIYIARYSRDELDTKVRISVGGVEDNLSLSYRYCHEAAACEPNGLTYKRVGPI
jgi:hypothetical protein